MITDAPQYLLTTNKAEAEALIARLDKILGYPNGNALSYASVILPIVSDPRFAVYVGAECFQYLTTQDKSKLVSALPATFNILP